MIERDPDASAERRLDWYCSRVREIAEGHGGPGEITLILVLDKFGRVSARSNLQVPRERAPQDVFKHKLG